MYVCVCVYGIPCFNCCVVVSRRDVTILREALQTVPNHTCELMVKAIAEKLANALGEQVK